MEMFCRFLNNNNEKHTMNLNLKGKNALVGGSSKGIGKASAIELALLGANVTLVSRSADIMHDIIQRLDQSKGQRHDFIVADFSDLSDVRRKFKNLVSVKPIHILVNNTGGPPSGPIVEATEEAFLKAMNNHLLVNHLITRMVIKKMKQEQFGRIINIISTGAKQPLPHLGVSNTTRAAVAGWAKTMANELGPFGITVNNILPGSTNTERLKELLVNRASTKGVEFADVENQMLETIPMGRFGTPEEIGVAVAFLASPAASYISGINLPVDGGRTKSL